MGASSLFEKRAMRQGFLLENVSILIALCTKANLCFLETRLYFRDGFRLHVSLQN